MVLRAELLPCPECDGTGQMWGSTDPDDKAMWCGRCYGTGVIEEDVEQ